MNELKTIRNKDLMAAYYKYMKDNPGCLKRMSIVSFVDRIINGGAPRFYISELKALQIVSDIRRVTLNRKKTENLRMCYDLYNVYLEKEKEMKGCYKYAIAEEAVNSPAPSFYIKPQRAIDIIWGVDL